MATRNTVSVKMTQIFVIFASVLSSVICSEYLILTHAPDYMNFEASGAHIPLTEVPQLLSSTFGFSLDEDMTWSGLSQGSLFQHPRANVLIEIDGFKEKSMDINPYHVVKYPIDSDHTTVDTNALSDHLKSSFQNPVVVDFSGDFIVNDVIAHNPTLFSELSSNKEKVKEILENNRSPMANFNLRSLNVTHYDDLELLSELELIIEVLEAMKSNKDMVGDASPDFYHFKLGGLRHLVETYGSKHEKVDDALLLIMDFVTKITEEFKTLYDNNVVVEVVTLSGSIDPRAAIRRARSLMQAGEEKSQSFEKTINLSQTYDDDYAAIANIIIWLVIGLAITIFVIAYALWNMDPGRDSIIYRMTSQRIKKE